MLTKIKLSMNQYNQLAGLILGMAVFLLPGLAIAQYSGPEFCQDCHEDNYNYWQVTGHPFALMKAEDARHRAIPLPKGYAWSDISYVVSGYDKKTLYLDSNGYFITSADGNPGNNQYNLETGEWSDYRAGEANVPFECGACHTTNYSASGNQDGLAGIIGTWDSAGVECEQCHGNGMEMSVDDSAEFCGTCHTRGEDSSVIPAADGFIMHNGQYNELLASPHKNLDCVSCHNPHKKSEFSITRECTVCHSQDNNRIANSLATHSMSDYGIECKDCHMPYATLAAQAASEFTGDRKTHIFSIDSDPAANMFNEAGDAVALDNEGKGAVTLDYACKRCHETADINELARHAKNFHGKDTGVSPLEYIGINPGLSGTWWGGLNRNGEGFLLDVADAGGVLVLIVSFYTYDSEGNQVYLIASGLANTGMTAVVDITISGGRTWGDDQPGEYTTSFGTGTFTFPSCTNASFTITPNADYQALGFTELSYDLTHDLLTSQIACPTFVNNAN